MRSDQTFCPPSQGVLSGKFAPPAAINASLETPAYIPAKPRGSGKSGKRRHCSTAPDGVPWFSFARAGRAGIVNNNSKRTTPTRLFFFEEEKYFRCLPNVPLEKAMIKKFSAGECLQGFQLIKSSSRRLTAAENRFTYLSAAAGRRLLDATRTT
ncbi:MAG: hypothetical protein JXB10_11045 [Pirellulales bacterium]|nr:hypothetical protein [Pirellulales bacterium]